MGFFCAWIQPAIAQKNSEKLRKEQERLEKSINVTKSLLTKAKSNTQATLSELKVLENQLAYREDLLNNFESQFETLRTILAFKLRIQINTHLKKDIT